MMIINALGTLLGKRKRNKKCKKCGNRTMGPWTALPAYPRMIYRSCAHCNHSDTKRR